MNKKHSFQNYFVTPSNRFAYLVAQEVCKSPDLYNPLYLYGPAGVGKTHLLQAIGEVYQNQQRTVIYISANQFLEEMIKAIQTGANVEFREKYHQVDILLFDRLQYVAGKEHTQKELFNIVEKRLSDHKQTVFAGNVHPSQIPILDPELSTCLTCGLCVEIPTPDFEGKAEIIYQKLKRHGLDWPLDACRYVALNISSGVNQIEGEINKIIAFSKLLKG